MSQETLLARQCLKMVETARIHQSLELHLSYRVHGQGNGAWEATIYVGERLAGRDRFEGVGDAPIDALQTLRQAIQAHFQQRVDDAHALFRSILDASEAT